MKQKLFLFALVCCLLTATNMQAQNQNTQYNVSENEKKEVIEMVGKRLVEYYVFPDVARQMSAALSKNFDDGVYGSIKDAREFAMTLTRDLWNISRDGHLEVWFNPQLVLENKNAAGKQGEVSAEGLQRQIKEAQRDNFGFREVKILDGNIGYLNLTRFTDTKLGAAAAAASAMNLLSHTDALIIDLRQNGGGHPTMVTLLASFLFDSKPVLLSDFYVRNGAKETREQEWTLPKVKGKKRPGTDVYILTAFRTFSAAESFAYSLQGYKRATVVGERTGGGAHNVTYKIVNDNFMIKVPNERPVDPNTKTNWEKTGVKPDIETAPKDALLAAQIKALEKLSAATTADSSTKFSYEWLLSELRAKLIPVQIDETVLRSYVGTYSGQLGQRKITFENGRLFSQRVNGSKVGLIPLTTDLFTFESRNDVRLKINIENNRVVGLTSIGIDGTTFQESRAKENQ
ncbi:MAG TPA: S41 family peptidase [Pyrinomonadaceae bacterium]|jgi:hypothetical protein